MDTSIGNVPVPTYSTWIRPPGLLGDMTDYIYGNAVNPVIEVAISAAIAYIAGIIARTYNISRTGLNGYYILLAPTAGGKEGASQGMDKITGALRLAVPQLIDNFIGPSNIASAPALVKQLADTPCFISHKGEIGFWFQKICAKYATANDAEIRGLLLDLFSKSGHGQVIRGSVYSDRAKNVPSINHPCFTLFGDSTQLSFYKAFSEDSIAEGLMSRLTIFECPDKRPTFNVVSNSFPPSELIVSRLAILVKRAIEKDQTNEVINISETQEATAWHLDYRQKCADYIFDNRDKPAVQIWTRAHLRLLRLAGLAAVCLDPDSPCVTVECLQWAEQIVNHGIQAIVRRFDAGEVGEVSFIDAQRKLLANLFLEFYHYKWNSKTAHKWGTTPAMQDQRIIPMRAISRNTSGHACFKNDKNSINSFRNLITEFKVNGVIQVCSPHKCPTPGKRGEMFYVTDVSELTNTSLV
jgi:hypothetical protein